VEEEEEDEEEVPELERISPLLHGQFTLPILYNSAQVNAAIAEVQHKNSTSKEYMVHLVLATDIAFNGSLAYHATSVRGNWR